MSQREKIDHLTKQIQTMMKRTEGLPYLTVEHEPSSNFVQFCPDRNSILCVLDLPKAQMTDEQWSRACAHFRDLHTFPIETPTGLVLQLRSAKYDHLAMEAFHIFQHVFEASIDNDNFSIEIQDGQDTADAYAQEIVNTVADNYKFVLQSLPPKEQNYVGLLFEEVAELTHARSIAVLYDILIQDQVMEHEGEFQILLTDEKEKLFMERVVHSISMLEPEERLRICLTLGYMLINFNLLDKAAEQDAHKKGEQDVDTN